MSYFGTDGIRGKFGEFPIHPQFLIKLGYATGKVLLANQAAPNENHRPNVVIGKDTRPSIPSGTNFSTPSLASWK